MIRRLLVANRGEIAVRIARGARELGISPVGVYSDADEDALFRRAMDASVRIGPGPATESYLDGERIETDLVISADGIGSAVRRTVVGKSEPALYAGYVDWHAQSPEAALPRIAAATLSERLAFCQMQGG